MNKGGDYEGQENPVYDDGGGHEMKRAIHVG